MLARGVAATRQLAKRQLTWLRGWTNLNRMELSFAEGGSAQSGDDLLSQALEILQGSAIYKNAAG